MNILQAIILGIVEGITEFLPISSTGHLTIVEELLGFHVDDPGITAFTAVIQMGAIAAVFVYFWSDIWKLCCAFVNGLRRAEARQDFEYRFGWYIIAGSLPIAVVGLALKDVVSGPLRNLWVVAAALILWCIPMYLAERKASQKRGETDLRLRDVVIVGFMQCIALIPGVSRSGATISGGLFLGFNRVVATRLSFFLSIPALTAAGLYEGVSEAGAISDTVGWVPTLVGTLVSFFVAYAAIAWLLRLVAHHKITVFIPYRIAVAILVMIGIATSVLSAT